MLPLPTARHPRIIVTQNTGPSHPRREHKVKKFVSRKQHLQIRPPRLATQLEPRGILLRGARVGAQPESYHLIVTRPALITDRSLRGSSLRPNAPVG